ncbi:MAG: tripartite tricarboxylate transporter TctB family protein [Gemmatimonadaceae bacterium]|nr:tripartite tricarboxylate transporter TctB family protein [Acetobacteraceae bacterium]
MKINARDVAAGTLLLVLAAIGLWLNQAHGLGTARRMGPGYLPMLVFWVQIALGALVLGIGLFNGPDGLEEWPWREQMVILAAICVFGLLLERGGLMLSIAATVVIASFADREQRPLGVLGTVAFLMVLCWWVFIQQLQIRVPMWPQLS